MTMTRDIQRWLTHLTQVSGPLTRSLDYDTTLRQVARMPIPILADWCMVYIPESGGPLPGRTVVAHASPMKEALLRKIWQREWEALSDEHPLLECIATRAPMVVRQIEPSALSRLSRVPEHAAVLSAIGARAMVLLPLVAHGTLLGGCMLVSSRTRRAAYDETLAQLLNELAQCYAQAIYNCRLFVEMRLALRLRDEILTSASQDLLELTQGVRHHPHLLESELGRIARRLRLASESL